MPLSSIRKLFRLTTKARIIRVQVRRRRIGALTGSKRTYKARKEEARELVHRKLILFNEHYRLTYGKVAIKNQSSRWGSCSTKGNLNFNFRILLLPEVLQDYIIVHELCHLAVFNHSKEFWSRVSEMIPRHAEHRKELTRITRAGFSTLNMQ